MRLWYEINSRSWTSTLQSFDCHVELGLSTDGQSHIYDKVCAVPDPSHVKGQELIWERVTKSPMGPVAG